MYNVVVSAEKTLGRLLSGRADAAIRFDDLCQLLESLGFEKRVRGSHHLFRKSGVEVIAVWQNLDDPNTLIYLLAYKDRAARDAGWAAFNADPKWTELRTKYFVPLMAKAIMMSAADYSPMK